jgi:hypothetical protein
MTFGWGHRTAIVAAVLNDGLTRIQAARAVGRCHPDTVSKFLRLNVAGDLAPKRKRRRIAGVMPWDIQDSLLMINAFYPQLFHDELAVLLFQLTGSAFTARQVRQVMCREKFKYRLIHEFRPLAQDILLVRYWRQHIIYPGGPITARHLVYLDEASRNKNDAKRRRAHGRMGARVHVNDNFVGGVEPPGFAASIVTALSLRGIMSAVPVEVGVDGNLNADLFMLILEAHILPQMNPFPAFQSVLVMDNAPPHSRDRIRLACQRFGVLPLFLFPYAYAYNPVELVFNTSRRAMQRAYGVAGGMPWPQDLTVGQVFAECIYASTTAHIACNYFEKCFIPVTAAERNWAILNA